MEATVIAPIAAFVTCVALIWVVLVVMERRAHRHRRREALARIQRWGQQHPTGPMPSDDDYVDEWGQPGSIEERERGWEGRKP